ncbi:MAG TPA: response regulator transcription factor [Nitrolancea sp.]|nr:response regulator transcription factor [Nitrolancea sp.]
MVVTSTSDQVNDAVEPVGGAASAIAVILIEDHTIVREGLKLIINQMRDIHLLGDASTGSDGLALFKRLVHHAQPVDVVITDLGLPDISGLEVAQAIKELRSETAVLILSMHADPEHVASILETGIDGYLLKQATPSELVDGIRAVANGGMALSPTVARRLLNHVQRQKNDEASRQSLTERELQVLAMLAQGATSKEIALDLALSVKTVENHRARILEKLDAVNTAAAIGRAYELGLMKELPSRR